MIGVIPVLAYPFTITLFPSELIAVDCPKFGILYAVRGVPESHVTLLNLYMIGVTPKKLYPFTITVLPSALIAVDCPKLLIDLVVRGVCVILKYCAVLHVNSAIYFIVDKLKSDKSSSIEW
jgi:hypothetical protein